MVSYSGWHLRFHKVGGFLKWQSDQILPPYTPLASPFAMEKLQKPPPDLQGPPCIIWPPYPSHLTSHPPSLIPCSQPQWPFWQRLKFFPTSRPLHLLFSSPGMLVPEHLPQKAGFPDLLEEFNTPHSTLLGPCKFPPQHESLFKNILLVHMLIMQDASRQGIFVLFIAVSLVPSTILAHG